MIMCFQEEKAIATDCLLWSVTGLTLCKVRIKCNLELVSLDVHVHTFDQFIEAGYVPGTHIVPAIGILNMSKGLEDAIIYSTHCSLATPLPAQ